MHHIMGRADYERLEVMAGVPVDTPGYDALRAKIFAKEYPKTTGAVVVELRARGLDVDINALSYLMRKGKIPGIAADTGHYAAWGPSQIDTAAAWLAEAGRLTPSAWTCLNLNIDFGQDVEARDNWTQKHGLDPYVLTVTPRPGKCGIVEYRALTKAEREAWDKAVGDAQ